MAVNYVKGQILSGILERDGSDIAIANANVGINTITPTVALDVNGNVQANNFNTTGSPNTGNITGANVVSAITFTAVGSVVAGAKSIPVTGNIDAGTVNINNVVDPEQAQDAATKNYVDQIVGNVESTGNITFSNTTISSNVANATITIQPTGTGLVTIDTTTGLVIPVGNTAQRPDPAMPALRRPIPRCRRRPLSRQFLVVPCQYGSLPARPASIIRRHSRWGGWCQVSEDCSNGPWMLVTGLMPMDCATSLAPFSCTIMPRP